MQPRSKSAPGRRSIWCMLKDSSLAATVELRVERKLARTRKAKELQEFGSSVLRLHHVEEDLVRAAVDADRFLFIRPPAMDLVVVRHHARAGLQEVLHLRPQPFVGAGHQVQ